MRGRHTEHERSRSATYAALALAAALFCGCLVEKNAARPHLDTKVYPITCEDGRRYAARALKARNYRITDVTRSGSQTVVSGRNDTNNVSSSLTIECQAGGVTAQASGGGRWVTDGLRFGFYQIAEQGDRIWPPPTGPVVTMELWSGPEAKIEFASELEPFGVVAVKVRVLNAGERVLRVDPRRVHVMNEGGGPVQPIVGAEAEQRLAGVDPNIKSRLLQPIKLKQSESTVGFVFFPAGAYTSGSLALIDDKTGEADDYDVTLASS